MSSYDNTNSGVLFRNDRRREGKNDPEYTGTLNVAGVEFWLSAWVKESKDGRKFFSLSVKKKDAPKNSAPAHSQQDEDVPF